MAGTHISFQGHMCTAVQFVRSRGISADQTVLTMPVVGWPAGFDWKAGSVDRVLRGLEHSIDLGGIRGEAMREAAALPGGLEPEGTLVLAEENDDGALGRTVTIPGMLVWRIETDQADDEGLNQFVRVTLVDQRFLWGRGIMPRWSFNRRRADSVLALDSATQDGELITRAEIAKQAMASIRFQKSEWFSSSKRWLMTLTTSSESRP